SGISRRRRSKRGILRCMVIGGVVSMLLNPYRSGDDSAWLAILWLMSGSLSALALVYAVAYIVAWFRVQQLRRFRNLKYSLAEARRAAGREGRYEELGTIQFWTDVDEPSAISATS